MHFQQITADGSTGYGMTMACNGVFLMPAYDIERDGAADDLWYVVHHSTVETLAVLAVSADRALEIAIEIANLRDWPAVEEPNWFEDDDFIQLREKYAGEIGGGKPKPDWEEDVPYGLAA